MKKVIAESAFDDDIPGRSEYFVARYEYDSDDEMFEDKDMHHQGWGKTKDEAIYNLVLQRTKKRKNPEKPSDFNSFIGSLYYLIFSISFLYFIIRDFGTISGLEWLVLGIFVFVASIYSKQLEKMKLLDEDDEDY